jgi:hypothetical protein
MKKIFTFRVISVIVIILFSIVVLDILFFKHEFNNKLSGVFLNQLSTALLTVENSATSTVSASTTKIVATTTNIFPPESPINYTDNNNGTITDNYTKLIWLKCPIGFSGTACKSGSPSLKEWSKSRDDCTSINIGGKKDWRLPTVKELVSIVDTGSFSPSINKKYFFGTDNSYWTSTSPAEHLSSKFIVLFSNGSVYFQSENSPSATRCVRSGN